MKPILFFDPTITIDVHSATDENDIHPMTIEKFSNGDAVEVYELDNGELRVEARLNKRLPGNVRFIEGPEV